VPCPTEATCGQTVSPFLAGGGWLHCRSAEPQNSSENNASGGQDMVTWSYGQSQHP
jgi:hypothetical protein